MRARVGLGQAALARQLRVQRHELPRERPLLVAFERRSCRERCRARWAQQNPQIVHAHALSRLERRRRVAILGLEERQHGEGG